MRAGGNTFFLTINEIPIISYHHTQKYTKIHIFGMRAGRNTIFLTINEIPIISYHQTHKNTQKYTKIHKNTHFWNAGREQYDFLTINKISIISYHQTHENTQKHTFWECGQGEIRLF